MTSEQTKAVIAGMLQEIVREAVAAEREACAEAAFQWEPETQEAMDDLSALGPPDAIADKVTQHIAAAIRSRK